LSYRAVGNPIFYGWFIVAAGFFALFVSMGARNGFGVFVVPMTGDLGWTRTEISAAISVGILVNGLSQPFLGRLYDQYGGRIVISLSLLVLGLATMLLAFTSGFGTTFGIDLNFGVVDIRLSASLLFLITVYGLVMSTASSGVSLVTVHAVLAKWFYRRRGIVLSVCTAGTSVGGLILTPFAASLILWAHWRVAWVVLGAFVLVLALPLVAILLRDSPEEIGEIPDGRERAPMSPTMRLTLKVVWMVMWFVIQLFALPLVAFIRLVALITRDKSDSQTTQNSAAPLESDSWKDSFRSPPIWQLSGAYFVCGVTTLIISTHYVPFAIDLGISPAVAALAFGMMQGLNAVGVLVVGIHADKFSRKNLLGTIYFMRFFAYVVLVIPSILSDLFGVGIPPSVGIWCFAYLAGMSWVATPPLTSSLTADIYGTKNLGTLGGFTSFAHQIGGSLSVVVAGILYDQTGTYVVPFGLAGLTLLGATLASYSIKERTYSARYQTAAPAPAVASVADGD
jgi:MFS family permease